MAKGADIELAHGVELAMEQRVECSLTVAGGASGGLVIGIEQLDRAATAGEGMAQAGASNAATNNGDALWLWALVS